MKNSESILTTILAAIALAAVVAAPAIGQEAKAPEIATMTTAPGSVSWAPRIGVEMVTLTVEGGGFMITRDFSGGQPTFAAVDPDGYQLPDGTYTWELRATPSGPRAGKRAPDRPTANGRSREAAAAPRALVQSGAFTILDGAVVGPAPARTASEADAAGADVDDRDTP